MQLEFGQPLDKIAQFAYVVEDIEASMLEFTRTLGVGPWYIRGPFQPPEGRYRGEPTAPTFSVARGFAGHSMVELIAQHDDSPSVYHEGPGPRTYGFHHWAKLTRDFDGEVERYLARGYEEAFFDRLGSGSRVIYLDATADLPGMVELVEYSPAQEQVYTRIYAASVGWDGSDPIRRED